MVLRWTSVGGANRGSRSNTCGCVGCKGWLGNSAQLGYGGVEVRHKSAQALNFFLFLNNVNDYWRQ